jgi:uncharacterized protein YegJ (DUF2314 family)
MTDKLMTKVLITEPATGMTECVWVEVLTGDRDEGTGVLANQPLGKCGAKYGDKIKFTGGTITQWPHFGGKL